ncbi:MAG: Glutathione synthetase [Alphaproteobacteria bacterium MarineAlpha2_Bin1]|nr:MAG: Glutathione synthetase [Alphaproteobacteria bacterium MarineAlpha2_Bin1]
MECVVAIQMNHISSIDIKTDSTYLLALEAQRRGHTILHYEVKDLFLENNVVYANTQKLILKKNREKFFQLLPVKKTKLSNVDIILMRQDPPFNMTYITATHLLEKLERSVFILNNPRSVRNSPEKLLVTNFNKLMPPTLISSSQREILNFRKKYKDIIIKPLFGNGGESIIRIKSNDQNFSSMIEIFKKMYDEPLMVQKFVKEVSKGDKRIVLLNGEILGAINRIPAKGEIRANMHVGAKPKKTKLSKSEIEICNIVGPELKRNNLLLAGIDVIGGSYLTEINVTSPTGLQEINRFDKKRCEIDIWNCIERAVKYQ